MDPIPVTKVRFEDGGDTFRIAAGGKLIVEGAMVAPAYPGDYPGRVYYVNNITGLSTNDGLSWETAMDEISTAITAAEAYRVLAAANNRFVRNRIYVQGTGIAYTALAALPNWCDIVGIGAEPSGNGTGIVIVGVNGADGIAGTARGLNLYNMQIRSGGAFWCADFVNLFRSRLERVVFQANDVATDGGIRFSGASGGITIVDCHWAGSGLVDHKVGISVLGDNFDHVKVRNNIISGTVAGVLIDAACIKGDHSIFEENYIGDVGMGCDTAVDDNSTAGKILFVKNSVMGTAKICCVNNGAARVHGNVSANGFIAVTAS